MTELFSDFVIEVYISSAWVDLTPDVLLSPPVRWNRGIMGNSQVDRVGSPGYLEFSLNNSADNSAGLLGYYSPGHTNVLSGWTAGLPVRMSFVYDQLTFYKFYGRIQPSGITIIPGVYGPRYVTVMVHDFMAQAAAHELQLLTLAENKTIDEVVPLVIANMPIAPLATDYETGTSTFPTVFDTIKARTTATEEFMKLSNSELGAVYAVGDMTGGETLRVEGQLTRALISSANISITSAESGFMLKEDGGYLLLETGGKIVLNQVQPASFVDSDLVEGTQILYGKNLANRVEVITYPRRVDADATTVLWSLQKSFEIGAGETKENYTCRYRDPDSGASYVNGRGMVTPVASTDYIANAQEDGGGADLTANLSVTATYGTEAVKYTLENTGGTDLWVTTLQARGKGIYIYDAVRIVYEDDTSKNAHGIHAMAVDMRYQSDPAVGELFAETILGREKDPDYSVERMATIANKSSVTMYGFLQLEPGRRLTMAETVTGIDRDFFVQGYEAEIIAADKNGLPIVMWMPNLQWAGASSGVWIWDTSTWGVNTTWG